MNCDDPAIDAPKILPDDEGATDAVVDHLLSLGHRRILFYEGAPGNKHYSRAVRRNRFQLRMQQAGFGGGAITADGDEQQVAERICAMLASGVDRPTAILGVKADHAIMLYHALWRLGVRVPRDVSIATYDDPWVLARMTPPLTTVATPMTEIGQRAAEMLVNSVESSTPLQPQRILVPAKLVIRDSTAAPMSQ
jgi:DNA-binding LacI/PurR family transcriptional regulator